MISSSPGKTERVWRSHSQSAGVFLSVAASHFEIAVTRHRGNIFLTMRGPETKAMQADCPADGEWLGVRFKLGAFCVTLYLVPRTAVLGALLLTGYLGGAIATHVRIGNPLFTHILFPLYVALFVWGGLYLREDRLRELLPFRK